MLHRLLRRIIWGEHVAWVYVDDTLLVARRSRVYQNLAIRWCSLLGGESFSPVSVGFLRT